MRGFVTCHKCNTQFPGGEDLENHDCQPDDESGQASQAARIAELEAEIEQLRVQLAACGVAAMCNTERSRKQQRCVQGDYGWSRSYQDVVDAVGREIVLQADCKVMASGILDDDGEHCGAVLAEIAAKYRE